MTQFLNGKIKTACQITSEKERKNNPQNRSKMKKSKKNLLSPQILSHFLLQVVQRKEGVYVLKFSLSNVVIYIFIFTRNFVCPTFAILPTEKVIIFIKYFIPFLTLHDHSQLPVLALGASPPQIFRSRGWISIFKTGLKSLSPARGL